MCSGSLFKTSAEDISSICADYGIEREVKKHNRELSSMLSNMDAPLLRLDALQKKYTELLHEMKRLERDYQKAKKRGDQLQKEKDAQRTELNKVTVMKDKLEKMSRDFTKENKRLKVSAIFYLWSITCVLNFCRMSSKT